MGIKGCIVECRTGVTLVGNCSGILFNGHWVLSHGTVLYSLATSSSGKELLENLEAGKVVRGRGDLTKNLKLDVIMERELGRHRKSFQLSCLWKCPLLSEAIGKLLGVDWKIGDDDLSLLLPILVLLCDDAASGSPEEALSDLLKQTSAGFRGQPVVVESTPFGSLHPELFLNSCSRGLICNSAGPVFLTDARSVVGCEGSPVFSAKDSRNLVGMLVCCMSWWRGEWVGLSIAASLHPVLRERLSLPPMKYDTHTPNSLPAKFDHAVVLVRCGTGWGSGVVIDRKSRIALTCSHVVRAAKPGDLEKVTVYVKGRKCPAELLYRTTEGLAFDIAVLRVGPGAELQELPLSTQTPVKGEPIVGVGYPLFSEEDNIFPSVTRGNVSHVSTLRGFPVLLQSTCCIQSGGSGGALVGARGGLAGIVVCNARDSATGAIFPHINLAVPAVAMATSFSRFLKTGDIDCLKNLELKDESSQRLWKLETPRDTGLPNKL